VRIQRQRKILQQRLKVPPQLNQFNRALDKSQSTELLNLLNKYRPETKAAKLERLRAVAGGAEATAPPPTVKYGLNHVTYLVEKRKAKMVIIAADVNPVELVVWLPALCRKMDIPYCIVKSKSLLGTVVHKKTAACLALTAVERADQSRLNSMCTTFTSQFNESTDNQRKWGGGIMGLKTQFRLEKREKAVQAELAKKAQF